MYSYRTVTVWVSRFGAWGYEEYRQPPPPPPNPEGGVRGNAMLFDNRQQKNSGLELCTLKQIPLDRDHMRVLDWQRLALSTVCEVELCARVSYLCHSAQIQIFYTKFLPFEVPFCEQIKRVTKMVLNPWNIDRDMSHWSPPPLVYL